jgi:hypothetical protein
MSKHTFVITNRKRGFLLTGPNGLTFIAAHPHEVALKARQWHEAFDSGRTEVEGFLKLLEEARKGPYGHDLSPVDVLEPCIIRILPGLGAYRLGYNGELSNLFKTGDISHAGDHLVADAVRWGARFLDCYDGPLVDLYRRHGFEVTHTIPWDDQYAPEGWDYERRGRPDVVYLTRRGW